MRPDRPTSFHYTTEDTKGSEQLENWHEIFSRSLLGVEIRSLSDKIFTRASFHQLAAVRVAFISASTVELNRSPKFIADGNDDIGLYINLTGTTTLAQLNRETHLLPGDATLILSNEPAKVVKVQGSWIGITVPRQLFSPQHRDFTAFAGEKILRNCPALEVLIGYLKAATAQEAVTPTKMSKLFAKHITELIISLIGSSMGDDDCRRMPSIRADIARHLENSDLSIGAVAARHGIGSRAVQMLFKQEGTTFTEYVLRARLTRVYRLLQDPYSSTSSIASLAFASGFNDLSYFNRAFRLEFGTTPSEVRRFKSSVLKG